nr:Ig-like domain repeat protein [Lachnospiraceae bacterium]
VNRAGMTYLVTENGQADIRVDLAVKDLVPELLEVGLFKVDAAGAETKVAGFHVGGEHNLTVSGGAGAWEVRGNYTFDSSQDGGYILKAYYTDIAQDRIISAVGTTVYYLDMTPVQLSVSSPQISDGTITNQAVTVVYTMRELNPEFSQFSFTYSSTTNSSLHNVANVTLVKPDGSEEDIPISELAARINTPSAWSIRGGVYTLTLIYKEDSAYSTRLTVRDVMDSEAVSDFRFRVDKAAPAIKNIDIKTAYEDKKKSDYSKFDNSAAEVLLQVEERIASAENMRITCVAKDDLTGETQTIVLGAPKRENDVFTYDFTIKKDFKGTIHFTMRDEVNQSDTMQLQLVNGIIIESSKTHKEFSDFSITENGKPNDNGFYNDAISLKLFASDTYSGIKSIEYSLSGKTSHVDFSENKNIKTSWEKTPVYIEAEKENEGSSVKASMKIVDNAGHEDIVEKTFKLDYTKPQILVSFDNNNSRNEKYYNQNRTATLTINELNYSSKNTKVTLTKDGITQDITTAFHTDGAVHTMEDGAKYKEYTMPLRFEEDGEYTFRVETIDLAGNKGVYVQEQSFIIDKTMPVMELTYDNNSSYEENYYSRGRTATLTVTERNFQPSDIQVNVNARVDGAEIQAPNISAFTTTGDVHTARISFANEGDYTISASGVDMAGNTARDIGQQQFTVDLTAPEILISGVEENTSYNSKAAPVVTVTDGNYDAENVVIEIIGGRNGQVKDIAPVVTAAEHGQSYAYPDLQYVESRDDCYVIKATATDKAGHQTEASVNYRVNRFGSTYALNPSLQRLVENYYGHAADDFSIIETNVDRLESYEVSYTLDNEIVNLVEGVDYEVVQSVNQNQWQQYEYQFHASSFTREGVYVLSVSSVDVAGNVTDNKAKNVMLEFCIDNTAPSCIISGVSEGQRFAEDEEFHIGVEVYDNISVDTVSVRINGIEKYTQADMTDGRLSEIAIDRDIQEQTIEVVCTDPAGNERTEAVHFIYEGGRPVASLGVIGRGMQWLWLLPVCGLAGVFIFLAWKRKREDSSAE